MIPIKIGTLIQIDFKKLGYHSLAKYLRLILEYTQALNIKCFENEQV